MTTSIFGKTMKETLEWIKSTKIDSALIQFKAAVVELDDLSDTFKKIIVDSIDRRLESPTVKNFGLEMTKTSPDFIYKMFSTKK